MAEEFRKLYPEPDVRVFCKWDDCNRGEFGLNELLYDVCVCRTETCLSARQGKTLRYVTKALWQVESEFARDSYEAVKDFNKLVIGSAENKLFVGRGWGRRSRPVFWRRCCRWRGVVAGMFGWRRWSIRGSGRKMGKWRCGGSVERGRDFEV